MSFWSPILETVPLGDETSCYDDLENALSRCKRGMVENEELLHMVVKRYKITKEQLLKEANEIDKIKYEGDNLKETLEKISSKLDKLENEQNKIRDSLALKYQALDEYRSPC